MIIDPTGKDGEVACDDETKTVTVSANYYYSRENLGSSGQDANKILAGINTSLESLKGDITKAINGTAGMEDYTVNIQLNLIETNNPVAAANSDRKHIGNAIIHKESVPAEAQTSGNRIITFNANYAMIEGIFEDFFNNDNSSMKHEFLHTFGLRDRSPWAKNPAPYIPNDIMSYDTHTDNGVEPFKRVLNYTGIGTGTNKKALINYNNVEPKK
jgi:hypothetical protein